VSRRAVNAPPFPCLQSPEVRRAYDLCEAAYDENEYRRLAWSPLPALPPHGEDDMPEWWQRYEVEIWNNKPVRSWLKTLLQPDDPRTAFENAARSIYHLAGLTEAEAEAVLLHHEGESWRQIARKLGRDVKTVYERITTGEAKLAALRRL